METTIIGIGIGIIIAALAMEPHMFMQYGDSIVPMVTLACMMIIVLSLVL